MQALEKYRNYDLIGKILGGVLLYDAATSVLGMFIRMIRWEWYTFSIWTIVYALVPAVAGIIFLTKKYQDKIFKLSFAALLVITKIIMLIRTIAGPGDPSVKYVFSNFLGVLIAAAFALFYLGFVNPSGNKNFLIVTYVIMGIAAVFKIFSISSVSIGGLGLYFIMMMLGFQETRTQNSNMIYIAMIGTAYYSVYVVLTGFLSLFSWYLPSFFSYSIIMIAMVMPLFVYDWIVPGQGMPLFTINPQALSGNAPVYSQPAQNFAPRQNFAQQPMQNGFAPQNNVPQQQGGFAPQQNFVPQPQQPVQPQQNNFDPMTGQPINQQPQQNNFDPMTGQPINQQPQQNNFDPMTGQPLNPQAQQPNRFDPMTGKPIGPNGGQ